MKVQQFMTTRGSYEQMSMVKLWRHPENYSFMQFSQNTDGFRQDDSQGF